MTCFEQEEKTTIFIYLVDVNLVGSPQPISLSKMLYGYSLLATRQHDMHSKQ